MFKTKHKTLKINKQQWLITLKQPINSLQQV